MKDDLLVRRATPEDARDIAELHVRSWQWAYRGLIPDDYLDGLTATIPRREAYRREWLTNPQSEIRTWVAVLDGRVVGFADTLHSRDEDAAPGTHQLGAIYIDGTLARQGIGRALHNCAIGDLQGRGIGRITLWVLDRNERARRFYEALGWRPDAAVKTEARPGGVELREVRYVLEGENDRPA